MRCIVQGNHFATKKLIFVVREQQVYSFLKTSPAKIDQTISEGYTQ
jgi:hypothetical protein